jgi:antitoxin MazE
MKTPVVPIGNSRGVRIPKPLLELCHIHDVVNLSVKGETIVIRPIKRRPRAGWEAAFKKMHQEGADRPVIPEPLDLDLGDWEW